MALIPHEDKIVYNTGQSNRFYITYVNKRVYINESGKKVLLGVDNDDRIYIGVEEDSKIKTIYSGRMTENIDAWNKNELKEPIEKEDIYVYSNSSYKLDSLKGNITDLSNNKEISYEGTLISVNNKNLISILNNEIKLKKID